MQRPLLEICHVLQLISVGKYCSDCPDGSKTHPLNVVEAEHADRVPVFALQQAVVRDPGERDLRHRQVARLRDLLDGGKYVEVELVPVLRGPSQHLVERIVWRRSRTERDSSVFVVDQRMEHAGKGWDYPSLNFCWVKLRSRLNILVERVVPDGEESAANCDTTVSLWDQH